MNLVSVLDAEYKKAGIRYYLVKKEDPDKGITKIIALIERYRDSVQATVINRVVLERSHECIPLYHDVDIRYGEQELEEAREKFFALVKTEGHFTREQIFKPAMDAVSSGQKFEGMYASHDDFLNTLKGKKEIIN